MARTKQTARKSTAQSISRTSQGPKILKPRKPREPRPRNVDGTAPAPRKRVKKAVVPIVSAGPDDVTSEVTKVSKLAEKPESLTVAQKSPVINLSSDAEDDEEVMFKPDTGKQTTTDRSAELLIDNPNIIHGKRHRADIDYSLDKLDKYLRNAIKNVSTQSDVHASANIATQRGRPVLAQKAPVNSSNEDEDDEEVMSKANEGEEATTARSTEISKQEREASLRLELKKIEIEEKQLKLDLRKLDAERKLMALGYEK